MEFTHIHSSGRFDRSNESLAADLEVFHKKASIVTHTEMSADYRASVFRKNDDKGWKFYRSGEDRGPDECVLEWDKNVWELVRAKPLQFSKMQFKRPSGVTAAPNYVLKAVLRSVENPKFLVTVMLVHMPVDSTSKRAEMWRDIMRGWVRWLVKHRVRHPRRRVILTGDWNKNYRQINERRAVSRYFAPLGYRAAWRDFVPKRGGTHGKRALIDGDYSNMRVVDCWLLADTPSSDHRPYAVKYRVRTK